MSSLQSSLPWVETPLIINAPMGGFAGPALATAVTRAGGIGFVGMVTVASVLDAHLDEVENSFASDPVTMKPEPNGSQKSHGAFAECLPIGIGFLLFITKLDDVLDVLGKRSGKGKRPPAIIWLFAAADPSIELYTSWSKRIRDLYSHSGGYIPQIWIQVGGSAIAAVDLALSDATPDAIIVQGSDAGGHGMEKGASLFGLLPEVKDLLAEASKRGSSRSKEPYVLASGGIVDARGALAALSMGAEGVVMGTRFLVSPETIIPHPEYQKRILAAKDGAQSTIRAKVFDELRGPNMWPIAYDGRALVSNSWRDLHENGVPIESIREGHAKATKGEDAGFGVESDRAVIWCGAGVGLVNEVQAAGDIVREVRDGVVALAEGLRNSLAGINSAKL